MDTFEELCVKLMVKSDIEDIIDLLQLTPEDLVRRFEDRLEENIVAIREFLHE
jgi:hypothetical protein